MNTDQPLIVQAGLSRSGSTVVWQLCDHLTKGMAAKTHGFGENGLRLDLPAIVTVRHPFDAATSYWQSSKKDQSTLSIAAFGPVFQSADQIIRYRTPQYEGPVKVIRYEDWFPDIDTLANAIGGFISEHIGPISKADIERAAQKCSYESNRAIANRFSDFGEYDLSTHIHGRHLNGGHIGKWKQHVPESVADQAAERLINFMTKFGYTR